MITVNYFNLFKYIIMRTIQTIICSICGIFIISCNNQSQYINRVYTFQKDGKTVAIQLFDNGKAATSTFYDLEKTIDKSLYIWDGKYIDTLSYNIVFILTGLLFAVALAITLNLIRNKIASKIYQTVYIMPHFLSMVIIAYLVFAFLNMESGFINNSIIPMIMGENAQKVNWYAKAEAWPIILFIVKTWQSVGYSSIVYLAAIAGIDTELYEAAEIDGASEMVYFFKILLPVCMPIIATIAMWQFVGMWNSYFDAMIYLNSASKQPLQLVLRSILIQNQPEPGMVSDMQSTAARAQLAELLKYATIIISSLPLMIMYPFFQKYFDNGIMAGAVKG